MASGVFGHAWLSLRRADIEVLLRVRTGQQRFQTSSCFLSSDKKRNKRKKPLVYPWAPGPGLSYSPGGPAGEFSNPFLQDLHGEWEPHKFWNQTKLD